MLEPDPASVYWEAAAARFLQGVIAARGEWYGRPVIDPSPAQMARLARMGYDPFGPDNKSGRGRLNARDAWRRAFIRAVYRANDRRKGGPGRSIEIEVGRKLPALGVVRPRPGRPVRARLRKGGSAAMAAVARQPESEQWAHGGAGMSNPAKRNW